MTDKPIHPNLYKAFKLAYEEGFCDGANHGNLPYKYPPINIAWRISAVRGQLTGEIENFTPKEWYKDGTVTDEPDEVIE